MWNIAITCKCALAFYSYFRIRDHTYSAGSGFSNHIFYKIRFLSEAQDLLLTKSVLSSCQSPVLTLVIEQSRRFVYNSVVQVN